MLGPKRQRNVQKVSLLAGVQVNWVDNWLLEFELWEFGHVDRRIAAELLGDLFQFLLQFSF